jgi:hypothetical protein
MQEFLCTLTATHDGSRVFGEVNALQVCLTPDGKSLVFTATGPQTARDLWVLRLDLSDPDHPKAGKPEPALTR